MVRTECRKCAHTIDKNTGAGCDLLSAYNNEVWAWHDSASWARDGKSAIAPTLCPGFEPQSNGFNDGQLMCAAGPWRTDLDNMPKDGTWVLVEYAGVDERPGLAVVKWEPEYQSIRFGCWSIAGMNRWLNCTITRFAVIGGSK